MKNNKIRVLVIDDSALVRQTLTTILNSDPLIEVYDTASDPFYAVKKIQEEKPDVITLDIQMPRMDGLTFLRKLMKQHPIPVVVISSLAIEGSDTIIKAFEYGAIEVIKKPQLKTKEFFEESKIRLCDAVKAAAMSKLTVKIKMLQKLVKPKFSADVIIKKEKVAKVPIRTEKIIMIGASTGGTEALPIILKYLRGNSYGIVIVQHMPEDFTFTFAKRLNDICELTVKEAESGDIVTKGKVLIAPGNKHLLIKRNTLNYYIEIKDGPLVNRHRPSVDVLFRSAARYAGKNAMGILMTGMGDDGAKGLLEMKEAGAYTIAQDEKSCVVFGMPKEAIKLNAVKKILSLEDIAKQIISFE